MTHRQDTAHHVLPDFLFVSSTLLSVAMSFSFLILVASLTQIPNFSSELRATQRQDTLWFKVIFALESGDDCILPHMLVPFEAGADPENQFGGGRW